MIKNIFQRVILAPKEEDIVENLFDVIVEPKKNNYLEATCDQGHDTKCTMTDEEDLDKDFFKKYRFIWKILW